MKFPKIPILLMLANPWWLLSQGVEGEARRAPLENGALPPELSLSAALSMARKNDSDRIVRFRKIRLDELSLSVLRRRFFPSLSLTWQMAQTRVLREDDLRDESLRADLSQMLWDGGQTGLSVRVALYDLQLAREEFAQYESGFLHRVRMLFFEALRAKEALALAERYEASAGRQAEISRRERELGLLLETDELLIRARHRQAVKDLCATEKRLGDALAELRLACRLDRRLPLRVKGDTGMLTPRAPQNLQPGRLLVLANEHHSGFRKNRLETRKAEEALTLARLSSFPVLSAGAWWQLGGIAASNMAHDFGASLSVSTPFFGSGLRGQYGLSSRRNTAALEETASASIALADTPGYFTELAARRMAAEKARLDEVRYKEAFAVQVERTAAEFEPAWRELESTRELVSILDRRLALLEIRVGLGEARRIDLASDMNEAQAKRLELLSLKVDWARKSGEFEQLLGVALDSLGLLAISQEGA